MHKLTYFPFGNQFDIRMGTALFTPKDTLIDADDCYLHEIKAKRQLLQNDHRYYYRSHENTWLAQWDALDKVLTGLSVTDPKHFILQKENNNWRWVNKWLNEEISFVFGDETTLPLEPLDWAGRQVQEDLLILSNDNSASLIAGQLCFANGWSLDDKFGQPFLTIHAPAPHMAEPTMHTAQKLMEKIQESKPVWRCSWNFKIWNYLDLSSRYNASYNAELKAMASQLTPDNIGSRLYLRIERQTISRLPRSGCVLFGVHMYQNSLDEEQMDKEQAQRMYNVLLTTPKEMLDYKAITPFYEALLGYLTHIITG